MMNAHSYVQTQCPYCRAAAWGHPTQPVACAACHQMIPALAAAPAPQPVAVQPAAQQPAQHQVKIQLPYGIKIPIKLGGKGLHFKILAVVVLGIVLAVVGVIVKSKLKGNTAKGNLSYSSLGIDPKKAKPDEMIAALEKPARKWRKDAVWWAINLQAVKADGTVDVNNGGAQVTYISLGDVQSSSKSKRNDSIKKYGFGPSGVDGTKLWGATDPWEGVVAPQIGCGIDGVVKQLGERGLTGNKTVRITFDPQFAGAVDVDAWHVIGEDPKIDAYYSMQDCSLVKD